MLVLSKRHESSFFGGCLIRKSAGDLTVSLYEYPKQARIPLHCHDHPYVSFVLRGCYTEHSGSGHSEDLSADTALLHSAKEAHSDDFHHSALILAIEFTPGWCEHALARGLRLDRRKARHFEISGLARKLHACLLQDSVPSDLARQGLALELTAEIVGDDVPLEESCASRARDIILANFDRHVGLCAIAEELNLHPSHLARAFRRRYGYTVGDFIRRVRVSDAARLLICSEDPLSMISARCGFYDQSHFTAQFRAVLGTTPGSYRKRLQRGFS